MYKDLINQNDNTELKEIKENKENKENIKEFPRKVWLQ